MTISSDFAPTSTGPTTTLPGEVDFRAILPELTSPQERYDHGYQRGYMAGYAEGARQAQAERAADLASQRATWAASQARASALLGQLAGATEQYLQVYGPREAQLTDELVRTAFELAEAIVTCELKTRPDRAFEVAHRVLMDLPAGPAIVRVHPDDVAFVQGALESLGNGAQKVTVMSDPTVGAGGCVVSSGATTVDGRLPQALSRAREAFCADEDGRQPAGPAVGSYATGSYVE
jgi:flagellar assembly protein FliH